MQDHTEPLHRFHIHAVPKCDSIVYGIPVMIIHGLLSEKIEKVTGELYMQSMALLNRIFDKEQN